MSLLAGLLLGGGAAVGLPLLLARRWARQLDRWQGPPLRWDWERIDTGVARFPADFLWGVSTSAYQVEGRSTDSNWNAWERATAPDGSPRISGGQRAGRACDHWTRFREDFDLARALGARAFRISLAWDLIEPEPGRFDGDALEHYREVVGAMRARGLEPVVTLHHFTHPLWFEERGGFEQRENLPLFVRFAERAFDALHDEVRIWCTINEPAVFALMGWALGIFPPGVRDLRRAVRVLANLGLAHARTYRALKARPGGRRARIGVVKNVFPFDPARRWHPCDTFLARALALLYDEAFLRYLETGTLRVELPGLRFREQHPELLGAGDFLGINYYSHFTVRCPGPLRLAALLRSPGPGAVQALFPLQPGEIATDFYYPIYAEGLLRALRRASRLGLPLYVTENGIADARDDRRALFLRRTLYALSRALEEGLDVRGYFYWSLYDNFEWAEGWDMKFGLCALEPDTLDRLPREGARPFAEAAGASWPPRWVDPGEQRGASGEE